MDSKYAANVCTVIALGMDYIWRHGTAEIKISAPVGSNLKMDNQQQNSGEAKRCYGEARHLIGASQGGVSEDMKNLPFQEGNVEKQGVRINLWAASHEEKWRHVPKKLKEKIEENQKKLKKVLQRQMIMDVGEGYKLIFFCVVENIEPQKKLIECDEIK